MVYKNHSLWLTTGQLVSTPLKALRLEADVQSYNTCSNRLILKASEKTLRSTDDHPKHIALAADKSQRLQNCSSFHRKAEELPILHPPKFQHRQNIIHFPYPPWQIAPLTKSELSPLFLVSLAELITLIWNANAVSPPLLHMDPLVEGQETRVQQQ